MRVVAGTARGRRLVAPAGQSTRPTSDRVREATFNALGSLGAIEDAEVVDLFAGSGAMGIEALSRGATHVTFVDVDHAARRAVKANLETTGLGEQATVVAADVLTFLDATDRHFDLAVLDPPYAFDDWGDVLTTLSAEVAVMESDREIDPGPDWSVLRSRRYGTTVVTICRRSSDLEETST